MAQKIFVSYKHSDALVQRLPSASLLVPTTGRSYVNELEGWFENIGEIYKGERDNESLDMFKEETIRSKLKQKIFDSSLTVILISKGMKDIYKSEKDQWIPWEVSYSLRTTGVNQRRSLPNALLGIVIPDEIGSYDYMFTEHRCQNCSATIYNLDAMFDILNRNMFNQKNINENQICPSHPTVQTYSGRSSYLEVAKWEDFVRAPQMFIEIANDIRDRSNEYNVAVKLK